MAEERILRTDADDIVGVSLVPEGTEFSSQVRRSFKRALIARIIADRLADEADKIQGDFFKSLQEAVQIAGVECWDDPSKVLPLWEEEPDDLLEEVLSENAKDEFGALVQLMASDLDGDTIAQGLQFEPSELEITIAQSALVRAIRPPIDI